jgi:hypothetical protein
MFPYMYFWFFDCLLGKVLSYFSKEKEKKVLSSVHMLTKNKVVKLRTSEFRPDTNMICFRFVALFPAQMILHHLEKLQYLFCHILHDSLIRECH